MKKYFYKKQHKIKMSEFQMIFQQYMKKLFLQENINVNMSKCE
jgi:hypothetical protein